MLSRVTRILCESFRTLLVVNIDGELVVIEEQQFWILYQKISLFPTCLRPSVPTVSQCYFMLTMTQIPLSLNLIEVGSVDTLYHSQSFIPK